jgi:hypothetical protein
VRRPKHVVRCGKTPVLTEEQGPPAGRKPRHIDVGLCDRALIGA